MTNRLGLVGLFFIVCMSIGCDNPPPKTQDPGEIEKIRESHVRNAQRERENK